LYLVRHGETLANCAELVVGQSDSPLTRQGKEQARQLYRYPHNWCSGVRHDDNADHTRVGNNMNWWRIYVSDLKRTQHTACLILGLLSDDHDDDDDNHADQNCKEAFIPTSPISSSSNDPQLQKYQQLLMSRNVFLESRIREMAKGVCEGLPKNTPYEQALEIWKRRQRQIMQLQSEPLSHHHHHATEEEPRKETPDQGWNRVLDWMNEVVGQAVRESHQQGVDDAKRLVFPVLAIMHAGILRTTLTRLLVNDATVTRAVATTKDGLLEIPNMSVTVVDLTVLNPRTAMDGSLSLDLNRFLWTAQLVTLTWTDHLASVTSSEAENAE
jgi:broad specificity phosphatase PhoE